ncbi:MAG: type 4b pilus protein PilO2 [Desulfovibrio sp.]|jgi:hypothetical protein|nr:type 4b pilus protein PilO2 [Desulfovibrio sp.]
MRIVRLFDRSYAVGLWWQHRPGGPGPKKAVLALARERAKEFPQDNYTCVALQAHQFGLGSYRGEIKNPRVYSLAAALAPEAESFVGVFRLEDDLWWLCVLNKGDIAPDGDACFATEEEARAAANSHRQVVGVDEVFYSSLDAGLRYLASALRPETYLQEIFPSAAGRRRLKVRIGLVVTLVALAAGGWLLRDYLEERELEELTRLTQDAAIRYKRELAEHPERFFSMGWQDAPPSAAAGNQCLAAMADVPLVFQGWIAEGAQCLPGKDLTVIRSHKRGASFVDLPAGTRLLSSESASLTSPLPALARRPTLAPGGLPLRDAAAARLYQLTQDLNARLQLSWDPPEQTVRDEVSLVCPWQKGRFDLTVPHDAMSFVFSALEYPGLMVSRVSYTKNNEWKIQGVSYVRPK